MEGQVLYRNEHLLKCAPGDRPAQVQIGTDLSRTKFHYDYTLCSTTWNTIKVDSAKADHSALFMKQYCCKFHNERLCVKCHTFNTKGLVHCIKCGAVEHSDPSKAKRSFVSVQDQIEFTNAELRTLVYKMNSNFRGKVTNPTALLRQRAKKHLKRARQREYTTIIERWDAEESYRKQLQEDENLTRADILRFDQLAAQESKEVKMAWSERQSRNANFAWDVVQSRGGGRQTIQTTLYPSYPDAVEAKASAPQQTPASSSST